jgi:hypothetical protein
MTRRPGVLEVVAALLVGTLGACVLVLVLMGYLAGMLLLGLVKLGRAFRAGYAAGTRRG